jgi:single-stranded DNA-binding protein
MDINATILNGVLAAPPELREFESGSRLMRYLLTLRTTEPRRRVDVIPVTLWEPPEDVLGLEVTTGTRLFVAASVQRRFWEGADGRRSRLEIVARNVAVDPTATDQEAC